MDLVPKRNKLLFEPMFYNRRVLVGREGSTNDKKSPAPDDQPGRGFLSCGAFQASGGNLEIDGSEFKARTSTSCSTPWGMRVMG